MVCSIQTGTFHTSSVVGRVKDVDVTVRQYVFHVQLKHKLVVAPETVDEAVWFVSQPMRVTDPLVTVMIAANLVFVQTSKVGIPVDLVPSSRTMISPIVRVDLPIVVPFVGDGPPTAPRIVCYVREESKTLLIGQPEHWIQVGSGVYFGIAFGIRCRHHIIIIEAVVLATLGFASFLSFQR